MQWGKNCGRGGTFLLLLSVASLLPAQDQDEAPLEISDSVEGVEFAEEWNLDSQDVPNELMLDEGEVDFLDWLPSDRFDSTDLFLRRPEAGGLEVYREDDRFDYDFEDESDGPGILERVVNWLADLFDDLFGLGDAVHDVAGIFPYLLFVGALILVIWTAVRTQVGGLFRKKATTEKILFEEEVRDIHALDFPSLLSAALAREDYRSAIRIHYLQLLQLLSSREKIDWRPEKTNAEYLEELRSTPFHHPMRSLTFIFDYVWYGEFPIDRSGYEDFRSDFAETAGMLGEVGK